MATVKLADVAGDGIGREVVDAALRVLDACGHRYDVRFEVEAVDVGADRYRRTGMVYSPADFQVCRDADAILLGALGLPDVCHADGTEAGPDLQFRLRFDLDLYAGVRPLRRFPGIRGPLNTDQDFSFTIIRENTEGLYASRGGGAVVRNNIVTDTMVMTQWGVDRIARFAFDWADQHPVSGRPKRVTCVDKANVLRSYAFFRSRFDAVANSYAGRVEADRCLVDAFAAEVVLRPARFHVAVAENMFGDIISDLGAALVGSLGLAPSGDIGDRHAVFQPAHGSAPALAGKNVANPVATVLSAALLLNWLRPRLSLPVLDAMARDINQAVEATLANPATRTADIGGQASTTAVTDAIIGHLAEPTVL